MGTCSLCLLDYALTLKPFQFFNYFFSIRSRPQSLGVKDEKKTDCSRKITILAVVDG